MAERKQLAGDNERRRVELTEELKRISPALAARDFVPVFGCFCFTGTDVFAYDDLVALQTPCISPIKGAVKGETLLAWLGASTGVLAKLEQTGRDVVVSCGRSELKLASLAPEDFIFKFPEEEGISIDLKGGFKDAFERALTSMGRDPTKPWQAGVTVEFAEGKIFLYSTNDIAASCCIVEHAEIPTSLEGQVSLMPPRFCELLLEITGREALKTLLVHSQWLEARFMSGTRLFSRAGKETRLDDYGTVFSEQLMAKKKRCVDVKEERDKIIASLDRALVILSGVSEKYVKLSVDAGVLWINAASPIGKVEDHAKLKDHPDIVVECSPEVLKSGLKYADALGLFSDCIIIKQPGFTHVISVASL